MKKITLFLAAAVVSTAAFAQSTMTDVYGASNPSVLVVPSPEQDPCTQSVATNNLENGGLFGAATNQRLAIDIDVPADMIFSIEEIVPTFVGEQTTTSFVFRTDAAGVPDAEIATVTNFTITDDIITGNNFGFDFHQYTFELTTPYELDGGATGTKFWLEIVSDADGWESSTVSSTGLLGAFLNDNTAGAWAIGTSDYVVDLNGDCRSSLGLGENLLSQVSIFPNPTQDRLNISVPSTVEINKAVLYDVLGKDTGLRLSNGTMNTSNLANGVYILNIETSAGSISEKIVKR